MPKWEFIGVSFMAIGLDDLKKIKWEKKDRRFKISEEASSKQALSQSDLKVEVNQEKNNNLRPWENVDQVTLYSGHGTLRAYEAYQDSVFIKNKNEAMAKNLRERFEQDEVHGKKEKEILSKKGGDQNHAFEADWSYAPSLINLSLWERFKTMVKIFFAD